MGAAGVAGAGMGESLIGGFMSAIGQSISTKAAAGAANYNSAVERENAELASRKSTLAAQAGEVQTSTVGVKTRATQGALTTNAAAGGESVNTGSIAKSVKPSEGEIGALDAYQVRSEAVKQAYGYQIQSETDTAQAALDAFAAKNDLEALPYQAEGTLLGASGSATNQYSQYLLQSGING